MIKSYNNYTWTNVKRIGLKVKEGEDVNRSIPMLIRGTVCAAALSLLMTGCLSHQGDNPSPTVPTPSPSPSTAPTPSSVVAAPTPLPTSDDRAMTLEEKLGQMIITGIDEYSMNVHARELIETYHVGGIILYKPNVKNTSQLVGLVNELKETNAVNKLPLWLGVDEEGGRVTRLPDEITKTPTSKEVGKTGSTKLAYNIGHLLGKELNAYGLNMDFAPDLDVNSNPNNPVIGDRSFGSNASIVSSFGIPMMNGLQDQQVVPVVKHFPGHGDTSVDSHIGLPIVQNDLARLRKLELIPFAEAIKHQADAIMVAHILLPKIDANNPASMSRKIMTDLLRKEMGFQGLIMTDDMTMGAIIKNYDLGESAVKSVLAGANIVMVGHDYEKTIKVITALREAVKSGRIPMETIDQSVRQVMKVKQKYQLDDHPIKVPDINKLNAEVRDVLGANSK
ncbi:beta-N-acetylhexosaminidase [Paenibacillus sp. yr247]|uniref:beta-N-acetylhexosaminidase n=1 Tax=Paenibacillus sp. yr247 TaxID=1761880 RepID=UPI00088E5350|nr:beta-N-acetylhexosaminidase [Paenibacillus sp. yr247]SDN60445.1 beta-N-acetylhexosaminidase [Paenibacillus sp. yr247]